MIRSLTTTLLVAALLGTSACSGLRALGIKHKDGLEEVDELLSHVERVQVEAAVSKERSHAAVESLRTLVAPEFQGDPLISHGEFVAAVELVEDQAKALRKCVRPLRKTGEEVFTNWAANLESFGNVAMRQRSQERLEETRKRYDAIVSAAALAQLALDAFHRDLADQALFLEHDFNASSVALVAQELEGLKNRGRELAKRLDACIAACKVYVEFSAPSGQVAPAAEAPDAAAQAPAPAPAPAAPVKKAAQKKKPAAPTATPSTGG